MKFTSVKINNYRSVEELEIDLSPIGQSHCRILAGINESGKSNTLRALSLLGKDSRVSYTKDANKKAKSEKKDIRIKYELDQSANDILLEFMRLSGTPEEVLREIEILNIDRIVTFDTSSIRRDFYYLYLKHEPKLTNYVFSKTSKQFEKLEDNITATDATIEQALSVSSETLPHAPDEQIELNEKSKWEEAIEDFFLRQALEAHLPRVIFWAYKDEYLINREINLNDFSSDPLGTSRPLHNVFNLAGIPDAQIPIIVEEALADGAQMGELADTLATTATNYLEKVWPEHRVDIKVHTSSPSISFHVVERDSTKNRRYEIAERSDGFKHFFAILLNLAAENSTNQLKDCLILLDEPEIHLHPSGAKFLRDELLKIAKNNVVVYTTHSIFMVDRSCLERHYKVEKLDETTQVLKIDSSNPFKEELVYEALGASVFELISEHNLLVEGLTDKKIFEAFTHKFRTDIQPFDINVISADSEQHFDKYCKFFNKNNIKGYIVADSDTAGSSAKNRILLNNSPLYNSSNTFEINDIVDTGKKSTLEDLLPKDVLETCIQQNSGVTLALDSSKTFAEQLKEYNQDSTHSTKIDAQVLKLAIADYVCADVTKKLMTKDKTKEKYGIYFDFVTKLHDKLKQAKVS